MRNLKRALALAMASVMTMSMMVVGAGALDFKDADDISNVTAATVLEALDIMIGDDAGNFNPEKVVSRAEMATILCRVVYGADYDASNYAGATTFTDISGHWAEKEIGMAFAEGWINGRDAATFDPNATVNTYEAAVMLQRALGYYSADDTKAYDLPTKAVSLANQLGMFDGVSAATYAGLTRDEVAVAVYNTMFGCSPVAYSSFTNEYYVINPTGGEASSIWTPSVTTKVDFGAEGTIANDVHAVSMATGVDMMGRPMDVVKVDGKEVATSTVDATAIYVDSTDIEDIEDGMAEKFTADKAFIDGDATADGVVVEVYDEYNAKGASNEKSTVYVVYTYAFGEVNDVDYDKDEDETTIKIDKTSYVLAGKTDIEEDDMVVFVAADKNIDTIAVAETVEGEVTATATSYVKIDGDKYTYAVDTKKLSASELEASYTLYMDPNGYVVSYELTKEAEAEMPEYLYVYASGDNYGDYTAKVMFVDGTVEIVDTDKAYTKGYYAFDINDDDQYELTAADTVSAMDADVKNGYNVITGTWADGKTVKFTDDTIFVDKSEKVFYEGFESVPSYEDTALTAIMDGSDCVVVFITDGSLANGAEDSVYVYLTSTDKYTTKIDGTTYYVYADAYVDGEAVEDLTSEKEFSDAGVIYEVELDADGYVLTAVEADGTKAAEVTYVGTKTIYVDDVRYTYTDDSVFIVVEDDDVTVGSAADLIVKGDDEDTKTELVVVTKDDDEITMAYIFVSEI